MFVHDKWPSDYPPPHREGQFCVWHFSSFLWTEIASAIPEVHLKAYSSQWSGSSRKNTLTLAKKRHQFCLAEIDIWLGHLKSLLIPSQTPPCPISGHSAPRPPRVGTFLLHRNLFPQLTLNQQLPQSDLMCSPSASSTEVISCSVQLHLLPMPAGTSLPPPPSSNIPNLVQSP